MTEERVAAILQGYDALNRGVPEEAVGNFSPAFEFVPPAILPESEVIRGGEGLLSFWAMWIEMFDDFHIEIEETIDAGDAVVVMAAACGTVKDSGVEVRSPSFPHVWTFREDQIVRMEAMQNRAMAMEALGLSDERTGFP
jgi:ketosteroid isomerase-like protein